MLKLLLALGLAAAAQAAVARPGTINYTEGRVTVDGKTVEAKNLGSAELAAGRVLETGSGKAEMLLTPGVFLRLGDNSAARMVSPSLTDTRVELLRGKALLEVNMLEKENRLVIRDGGSTVRIAKKGLYRFDADAPLVAVHDGKVEAQIDDRSVEVGKGKTLALEPAPELKPQKFDRKETDELMDWSKLRSQYLAEANASSVRTVVVNNPSWWAGTGWYWNPWYRTWAFIPATGFYDSFWGYGFYSPRYWSYNPPVYYYPQPGWRSPGGGQVVGPGVRPPARPGGRVAPSAPSAPAPAARPAPAPMGGNSVHFGRGRGK